MFKELMNMIGGHPLQNAANTGISSGQLASSMQNSILGQQVRAKVSQSKRIFQGNIEVLHVSNGYVVNIGTKEGYEYTTHIASTIVEVNEIIAAAMVAFQLENS